MLLRAAMMLLRVGLKVDLDEKVANLSISHKQMLEIAKTLMLDAKVIIMDEPTSSLTNKEVDYLFLIMNQLRKEGYGHRLYSRINWRKFAVFATAIR